MTKAAALDIPSLKDKVSPEEWAARVDLAAAYRACAMFGWEDLVFTHISLRVPGTDNQFLINPYGVFFDEISASSLVKIDTEGNKVEESPFPVNAAGFIIHSAIHEARHDAKCVLHTHTLNGVAVAAQHGGLLPLSQHSMSVLASIGYHDYEGPAVELEEQKRLVQDLGSHVAMILRNHGLLAVGATIPEAFITMYWLDRACQAQVYAMNTKLSMPAPETVRLTNDRYKPGQRRKIGELEWAGLLRLLERRYPGFRD